MIKPFCDLIFISFTELVQYIFDERLLDFCYVVYWWLHLLSLSESRLSLLLSPGEGNTGTVQHSYMKVFIGNGVIRSNHLQPHWEVQEVGVSFQEESI